MKEIKSPCKSHCRYDYEKKQCKDCYRTMAEIVSWSTLTNEEKLLVLQKAEIRKRISGERFNAGN